MPLDQHLSAVPRAVTRVRKASRVLEGLDTVEHNEARRVRRTKMKPVVPSTCEALREATEVASLPPPPIRVAAGSAQVRPPRPRTHVSTCKDASFLRVLGLRSRRVVAAPN